jgi:hypothetical protein
MHPVLDVQVLSDLGLSNAAPVFSGFFGELQLEQPD